MIVSCRLVALGVNVGQLEFEFRFIIFLYLSIVEDNIAAKYDVEKAADSG